MTHVHDLGFIAYLQSQSGGLLLCIVIAALTALAWEYANNKS